MKNLTKQMQEDEDQITAPRNIHISERQLVCMGHHISRLHTVADEARKLGAHLKTQTNTTLKALGERFISS